MSTLTKDKGKNVRVENYPRVQCACNIDKEILTHLLARMCFTAVDSKSGLQV